MKKFPALFGVAAAVLLGAGPAHSGSSTASCDRECLHKIAWDYMDGMERHDLSGIPLAAGVVATENMKPVKPGEGLFASMIHMKYPRQYVADAKTGQIGVMGVLTDWVGDGLFSIRLKVVNHQVTEIETQVAHDGETGWAFLPVGFLTREAPYIADIPVRVRTGRDEILEIARNYWTVVSTTRDPEKVKFTDSCVHNENGMNTDWEHILSTEAFRTQHAFAAGPDGRHFTCYSDVEASPWGANHGVRAYRAIADEERGLVMVWNLMDIGDVGFNSDPAAAASGKAGEKPAVVDATETGNFFQSHTKADHFTLDDMPVGLSMHGMSVAMSGPRTTYNVEIQRIIDGKIDRQQVFMRNLPLGAKSSW